jgi:hypothetical protein
MTFCGWQRRTARTRAGHADVRGMDYSEHSSTRSVANLVGRKIQAGGRVPSSIAAVWIIILKAPIWLEADVVIRQLSTGAKSLNDSCRAPHGGSGGAPVLKMYTLKDVENAVQPYAWAGFFQT